MSQPEPGRAEQGTKGIRPESFSKYKSDEVTHLLKILQMAFNHLESDPKPSVAWFLVTPSATASSPTGLFDMKRTTTCLRDHGRDNATDFPGGFHGLSTKEDAQKDDLSQPCVH